MLANITLFEFRYQLRRPIALVSFLVFGLLAFGLSAAGGAARDVIPLNAPWRLTITFGLFTIFTMFLSLATLADVALRDGNTRMDEIMRSQPVRTAAYLGAKFAGAYAVACLAFLGVVFGHAC